MVGIILCGSVSGDPLWVFFAVALFPTELSQSLIAPIFSLFRCTIIYQNTAHGTRQAIRDIRVQAATAGQGEKFGEGEHC